METTQETATFNTFAPTPAAEAKVTAVVAAPPSAKDELRWLDVPAEEMMATLKASLYPGATDAMVLAVMDYCKAARLNIMLKPVHIVPMFIPKKEVERDGQKLVVPGTGVTRDIIMPGINHYRVQASRSGVYLGKTAPEWGPKIKLSLSQGTNQQGQSNGPDVVFEVPEWCRITVFKLVAGYVVPFTAEEYWIENYATQSRYTKVPNAMWQQRPQGQLAKVTEAQALRQAFPELCGGETAEEMAGKTLDADVGSDGVVRVKDAAVSDKPRGASDALDSFAGKGSTMKPAKKTPAKAKPKDDEPIDDSVVPEMPAEVAAAWTEKEAWGSGWKWLNEVMPACGPKVRQQLANDHADLLRAVWGHNEKYKAAAEDFVKQMGVVVGEG